MSSWLLSMELPSPMLAPGCRIMQGARLWKAYSDPEDLPSVEIRDREWPLVSIVTPSSDQRQFLEETIRSVLQRYANLEYVIIDGGSTDGNQEIIRKYEAWLSYWASEPDKGQAHAINKGFARVTSALLGWIDSDEPLLPGAFERVALAHRNHENAIILGDVFHFMDDGLRGGLVRQCSVTLQNMTAYWRKGRVWNQPGTFFPRRAWERVGPLDEHLRYDFDRDLMCRLLEVASPLVYFGTPVAAFRLHESSKTVAESARWGREQLKVTERYSSALSDSDLSWTLVAHELVEAALKVSLLYVRNWNPSAASDHVRRGATLRPQVLMTVGFWQLCLRMLVPAHLARLVRRLWLHVEYRTTLSAFLDRSRSASC